MHRPVVDSIIIFVLRGSDHVKVATNEPRASGEGAHVLELGQEGHLRVLVLGAVDASDPPWRAPMNRRDGSRDVVDADGGAD